MLRRAFYLYIVVCIILIATSLFTGWRASRLSGNDHYLLTTTTLLVEEEVRPESEADAAFDAALREAGEPTALPVEKNVFVLGFADATGPVVVLGGLVLLVWRLVKGRTRRVVADAAVGL
jgi:hypothetical protein